MMLFNDISQPAFLDPWDLPTFAAAPALPDSGEVNQQTESDQSPSEQSRPHAAWRDLLADIRDGVRWGLTH